MALVILPIVQTVDAQQFKLLYRFTGGADGGNPQGRLLYLNGKIYGTSAFGGRGALGEYGAVFEIDITSGQETTLHTFSGKPSDGAVPYAGLTADAAGNLYGTTSEGGSSNGGTIYKIDPAGAFSILYEFSGPVGTGPVAGLTADSSGNLYGTSGGGAFGHGSLFKMDTAGNVTTVFSFDPKKGMANPDSSLLLKNGQLYGTTQGAALAFDGSIFRVNAVTGEGQRLYPFPGGAHGEFPFGGLIGDGMGDLYGVTMEGGTNQNRRGLGVVFAFNVATLQETALHTFTGAPDGATPAGSLVRDQQGNFYGTTNQGGTHNNAGTVFRIDASGHLTILHSLGDGDGNGPVGGLAIGPNGTLYGTTQSGGGQCDCGTVFAVVP